MVTTILKKFHGPEVLGFEGLGFRDSAFRV